MLQALTVTDVLTNGVGTKGIQLILTEASDTRVRKLHMHDLTNSERKSMNRLFHLFQKPGSGIAGYRYYHARALPLHTCACTLVWGTA